MWAAYEPRVSGCMMGRHSIAKKCLAFSGLFEAELLLELMLRQWDHPHAADPAYRNELLERAMEVIRLSIAGTRVMEDVSPENMNFVAAVWYSEWNVCASGAADPGGKRKAWLEAVRRAIPSCFCDPELLP
jgi:hypothetical protein